MNTCKREIEIIDSKNDECNLKIKIVTTRYKSKHTPYKHVLRSVTIKYIPCAELIKNKSKRTKEKIQCPICKAEYVNISWNLIKIQRITTSHEIKKFGVSDDKVKYIDTIVKCGCCDEEFILNSNIISKYLNKRSPTKPFKNDLVDKIVPFKHMHT